MLRIVAGEFRSRQLVQPDDEHTSRPYLNRVKESVFNLLRGWFEDASVLDLFAGVGTMGLEAVSRGASHVVLVERDQQVYSRLLENIEQLGCGDRAIPVQADALGQTALLRAERPVKVIFVDPPYAMMEEEIARSRVMEQVARCRQIIAEPGWLVLRSPLGPKTIDLTVAGFDGPEVHRYARDMRVLLYAPNEDQAPETAESADAEP